MITVRTIDETAFKNHVGVVFCCTHTQKKKLSYMRLIYRFYCFAFYCFDVYFKLENQTTYKIHQSFNFYYLYEVHHFPIDYINPM